MGRIAFERIDGTVPLVLIAPHGGRRDPTRDPWGRGGLRTNDLHTAELTRILARTTGAFALVNDTLDRNHVDLNRIDQVADRQPGFFEALGETVEHVVARRGRAVVVTVHGWNTTAPAIDVGVGCRPGRELDGGVPGPAVSPAFVLGAVPALGRECARRGIDLTLGRRYPARAPQNLIQLFTGRWADDPRPGVRRIAVMGARCEAMQLELGLPLRWPGPWREALVDAVRTAVPSMLAAGEMETTRVLPGPPAPRSAAPAGRRIEFVSEGPCGMAAIDARGGRLLLVGLHDGLDLFTHDRVDDGSADRVGALALVERAAGIELSYDGPIGRFPHAAAFLDLEAGLASASVAAAEVRLVFTPTHPHDATCPFGEVSGHVRVGRDAVAVRGPAFLPTTQQPTTAWLQLPGEDRLVVDASGRRALLCRGDAHHDVDVELIASAAGVSIGASAPPAALDVRATARHRIPIVRGDQRRVSRVTLATYRVGGETAGWGQRVEPVG